MTNYKLAIMIAACLLCGSLATAACSSGGTSAGAESKPAAREAAATAAVPAADSIGVAECDQYLAAYESCLKDKVPAAARDMMKTSSETTRATWRQAAATPEGRAGLVTACKSTRDAARQSMSSYGCQF